MRGARVGSHTFLGLLQQQPRRRHILRKTAGELPVQLLCLRADTRHKQLTRQRRRSDKGGARRASAAGAALPDVGFAAHWTDEEGEQKHACARRPAVCSALRPSSRWPCPSSWSLASIAWRQRSPTAGKRRLSDHGLSLCVQSFSREPRNLGTKREEVSEPHGSFSAGIPRLIS